MRLAGGAYLLLPSKRYLGCEPQFSLQDALKDLANRMRSYLAGGLNESAHWG